MDQQSVNQLLCENMQNIFRFSLSRLWNRQDAEDPTSEILLEVLRSADKIRDEDKFFGFLWRVARNTYADFLKKHQKNDHCELSEEGIVSVERSVEDEIILRESLKHLRRELSLLSEIYRRSTVLYYFENLSCRQIAEKLGVSTEMVKYNLFRARNIIREGITMERILGEKSYRPYSFEIDFWGTKAGEAAEYKSFQNRKIRGNILLAAYYAPVSAQDLGLELGVAMPYLEDEIRLLEKRQYLIQKNGKYLTNIPIFTRNAPMK